MKSNVDFNSSKHLFNHFIYKLASETAAPENQLKIIEVFMKLFLGSSAEVTEHEHDGDSFDSAKVLGLKQSSKNIMEFSSESHTQKLRYLIKPFNKHILK
jgi:hypothetical protein